MTVKRAAPALVRLACLVTLACLGLFAGLGLLAAGSAEAAVKERAPSGPPLLTPGLSGAYASGPEASASAPPSTGDVLAANGLSSPLCRSPIELGAVLAEHCRSSSFSAASAPTGDYAFDVNIDTGVGQVSNDASVVVQDFAEHVWMALVAVAHGLIVMLEWGYSLNLLGNGALRQASYALHALGLRFTQPWLAGALSIASALAAYQGLVRRRIHQAVAQALATLAMMLAALWLTLDPAATVGSLAQWADEGALGTLAVALQGTAAHPRATLASGMAEIFGAAVTAPWCYLEFGDVAWCEDRTRLDPRLRKAAFAIAKRLAADGCSPGCSGSARQDAVSASLLRAAANNGELFLALPANELLRNSSKQSGSLLNVLCGGGPSADACRGPTAGQAEFRSERGTNSRLMGLVPICVGALGMLLAFGLLAVRLLLAAVTALLYLLLAPAVTLAAALGEEGRMLFRAWAMRLLAACVSKLAYSFLLGVLLLVTRMLLGIAALGWGAQWCLVSALWWTAFVKRHRAFGLLAGERRSAGAGLSKWRELEAVEISRLLLRVTRGASHWLARPGAEVHHRRLSAPATGLAGSTAHGRVGAGLDSGATGPLASSAGVDSGAAGSPPSSAGLDSGAAGSPPSSAGIRSAAVGASHDVSPLVREIRAWAASHER